MQEDEHAVRVALELVGEMLGRRGHELDALERFAVPCEETGVAGHQELQRFVAREIHRWVV